MKQILEFFKFKIEQYEKKRKMQKFTKYAYNAVFVLLLVYFILGTFNEVKTSLVNTFYKAGYAQAFKEIGEAFESNNQSCKNITIDTNGKQYQIQWLGCKHNVVNPIPSQTNQ